MSWSLIADSDGFVNIGAGTETFSLPAGLEEGDIVIVAMAADTGGIAGGNIQTSGYQGVDTVGSSPSYTVKWKQMGATPDSDITFIQGGSRRFGWTYQVWRGGAKSGQPDADFQVSNNDNPPSITTVADGALVFAITVQDDDDAEVTSPPTGYSNLSFGNTGLGSAAFGGTAMIASKIVASAGVEDPGPFTTNVNDSKASFTISFAPVAGPQAKRWNGSEWVDVVVTVWDGSQWTNAQFWSGDLNGWIQQ